MYRMEAVMASELAQLESRTTDAPQPETEPEKEDVDFEFNGNNHPARGQHHHTEIYPQMRRTSSNRISRAPTKRKKRVVMETGIPSQNGIFRKKNGG